MARVLFLLVVASVASAATPSLYGITAIDIDGKAVRLDFTGKVTMVMNVATNCGFTKPNYEMLTRLQSEYSGMPVRLVLVPCNQFEQEPGTNAEIRAFAEKYVELGPLSNVVLLAKSNLNAQACAYSGADACTLESKECCPENDAVYNYLLANTAPGSIKWNFDKIFLDGEGKPYAGEKIFHGDDTDSAVKAVINKLLLADGRLSLSSTRHVVVPAALSLLATLIGMVVVTFTIVSKSKRARSAPVTSGDCYVLIA